MSYDSRRASCASTIVLPDQRQIHELDSMFRQNGVRLTEVLTYLSDHPELRNQICTSILRGADVHEDVSPEQVGASSGGHSFGLI